MYWLGSVRLVEPLSLGWIFRPERVVAVGEHVGKQVRSVDRVVDERGQDGVDLDDGTRLRAYCQEIVPG
jgi:hypothetical protein